MHGQQNQTFLEEVIKADPSNSLPCNLSNELLELFLSQSSKLLDGSGNGETLELLTAVIRLAEHVNGLTFSNDNAEMLFPYFKMYTVELALEEMRRRSNITSEPADLDTIFTQRDLEIENLKDK